jgi:hypothetical protein
MFKLLGKLVMVAGVVAGGVYLAKPSVFVARPPKCKPIPVSALDPQPGLAPFRCAPDVPGQGPDIAVGEPRRRYGAGEDPRATNAPPAPRPARAGDLQRLSDERDAAYLDYLDAQDNGDAMAAQRAYAEYGKANARLNRARGR